MTTQQFDPKQSLGNQSRWHVFFYLVRIHDWPGAFKMLFIKWPVR